jgi:hypothetical protein
VLAALFLMVVVALFMTDVVRLGGEVGRLWALFALSDPVYGFNGQDTRQANDPPHTLRILDGRQDIEETFGTQEVTTPDVASLH